MARIEETHLPGVGVRYEFVTEDGERIGVVHHRGGRREVFVCRADEPDSVVLSLDLSDDEAHTFGEMMGVATVVEKLADLQQSVEGLAIDWLSVDPGTPYAGKSIGDARIRTRTGVSVVAVIRGTTPFPAPGPEFRVEAGDTLVVVGTPKGIEAVTDILSAG
ncbi:MAG TPA: cation:proton antiporter regulatory subunit [Acidimicrobiia bacterium]|nr:cation:proton antiporter regulatory subunit [Acidimicrobiia bacterium]